MPNTIEQLYATLLSRQHMEPNTSYVASLYAKGLNKILEKVGEEAIETVIAAKEMNDQGGRENVINETADLWFHTLVMLAHLKISPNEITAELERRMGQSGLTEKASRTHN